MPANIYSNCYFSNSVADNVSYYSQADTWDETHSCLPHNVKHFTETCTYMYNGICDTWLVTLQLRDRLYCGRPAGLLTDKSSGTYRVWSQHQMDRAVSGVVCEGSSIRHAALQCGISYPNLPLVTITVFTLQKQELHDTVWFRIDGIIWHTDILSQTIFCNTKSYTFWLTTEYHHCEYSEDMCRDILFLWCIYRSHITQY